MDKLMCILSLSDCVINAVNFPYWDSEDIAVFYHFILDFL